MVMALLLVLASVSAVQSSKEPGYMEVEKDNKTVRVPVVILGNESAESYWGPEEPASGVDVRITFPGDGLNTTMENISAYGRAWAEGTVDSVEYRLNNGTWKAANGTVEWRTDEFQLQEGPNTLEVRATDGRGNVATDSATVHYSTLTLDRMEWRAYEMPIPIYKRGTFYTDTGFKIKVSTPGDGSSCSAHQNDPYLNPVRVSVYDPKGRLYASSETKSLGEGTTVHVTRGDGKTIGIMDWSYDLGCSSDAPQSAAEYPQYLWMKEIKGSDTGGGGTVVKNLKVYINEPVKVQTNVGYQNLTKQCTYEDEESGKDNLYLSAYRLHYTSLSRSSCKFGTINVKGNFVAVGDEESPVVHNGTVYEQGREKYVTWMRTYRAFYRNSYKTIYHPTFSKVDSTKGDVIVRVSDDSGTGRTERVIESQIAYNIEYGLKRAPDGFDQVSPREAVEMRGPGGSWVQAGRVSKTYPIWRYLEDYTRFNDYYAIDTFGEPTEYAKVSASALGLIQNQWNTVEVKATDWSGRTSNSKVRVFYDTLSPEISTTIPPTVRRPVFDASVTATDNFKMEKLQVRISDGEFTVNGNTYTSGEWANVSAPAGTDRMTVHMNDVAPATGTVNITIRAHDEAGNMRERVKTVDVDAPPIFVLTSHEDGGTYGPAKNAMFDGRMRYTAPPHPYVWMKVNNGQWVRFNINPNKDSVHVESDKLLFTPNSWNTLHVMTKSRDGREYQYSIEVYYNEPDKVVYDFDSLTLSNTSTYPEGWGIAGIDGSYTSSDPNAAYRKITWLTFDWACHKSIHLYEDGTRVVHTSGGTETYLSPRGIHRYKFLVHGFDCDDDSASGKIASAKLAFSKDKILSFWSRTSGYTRWEKYSTVKSWVDDVTFSDLPYDCTLKTASNSVDIGPSPDHYFTYVKVFANYLKWNWLSRAKVRLYNETGNKWETVFNRWGRQDFTVVWNHPSLDYTGLKVGASRGSRTEYLECTLP